MSLSLFLGICVLSVTVCEEITKKSDSEVAAADFLPQFQPFQFPPQPLFTAPHDLTALQQTHVLANFHHRFHPTRLNPQFGVNPPLVLTPQTHIVPPQPVVQQNPIQSLVPPQPSASHHEILRPPSPQEQPAGLVPPQPDINTQNFKTPPSQKPTFPSPNDQSIKNSFPSNAPHTIKFSISSVNYNPNQVKQQVSPPAPQPPINHQLSSSVSSGRFVTAPLQQNRPNQVNTFHQQSFNDQSKLQQTNFQNFNLNKPDVRVNQPSFNVPSTATFGQVASQDLSSQFQLNSLHSNRQQQSNDASSISILPSVGSVNGFKPRPTESQTKFTQPSLSSTNFDIRQNSIHQGQINQQQFLQNNFDFSQSHQTSLQSTPQTSFKFQTADQHQFKIQSTDQPQHHQFKLQSGDQHQQHQFKIQSTDQPQQHQFKLQSGDQHQQHQFKLHSGDQLQQHQFKLHSGDQLQQHQFKLQSNDQLQQHQFKLQSNDQLQQQQFKIQSADQPQQHQFKVQPPDQPQQHQLKIPSTDQPQQHQFKIQPSVQTNFEYRPTEQVRVPTTDSFPRQQQIQISQNSHQSRPTFSNIQGKDVTAQKHLEQAQFFAKNEITASPSPTTAETFTTVSTKYRKPKPIVKEITINLNDQKITGDIPAQLYIKEDRQKEFQDIKEHDSKERSKGKKEKSQEDIINEQIQKLLQSHNLEIIDKDNDSQTESQEAQLSQFSEQFKKKYNYSVQLVNGGSLLREVKTKKSQSQKVLTTLPPLPELPEHIKKQYDIKLVNREDLFKQFSLPENHKLGNDSSVFLANGQQLEVVKFSKDGIMNKIPIATKSAVPTTTVKPPKVLFEELTRGVIPPGADFELIKHKGDGQVEKVNDLASAKKVTFVFLEEQPDGSVKIQGVKGNTNQENTETETVDSLIKKIKDGSLKLPPSKQGTKSLLTNEIPRVNPVTDRNYVTFSPVTALTQRSIHNFPTTAVPYHEKDITEQGPTTFSYSSPYAVDIDATLTPTPFYETTPEPPTTFVPTVNYIRSSTRKPKTRSRVSFLPTLPTVDVTFTPTFGSKKIKATTAKTVFKNFVSSRKAPKPYTKAPKYDESEYSETLNHNPTEYTLPRLRVPQEDVVAEESSIDSVRPINDILKENGLKEMAKFLDQSGLDTILNETGPYTIFIPTDKAFRTLEDQLGGPDKAEDKFRENPRLLSGLLLHHVVPGSFRLEDLQDEMTGVSLAGTQLRVNTYDTEEKNEERIVTINGAQVSNEKKDILVPQGLAHAIDRVLFPLPVGDIVQTLRGDRERRFTKFLKSLESSGLTDMLTGTKTYTVFAPTDKAFAVLTDSELDSLLTRREAAKTIVLRHVVPGTLYSAGMNYYQVKESMETGQKIIIKKELGKIKANSAQIVSANIPATNGVVHAVESLL